MSAGRGTRRDWAGAALAGNAVFSYVFLYAPVVVLVVFSFSASRYGSVWGGFSTEWYAVLFRNEALWRALGNTLTVAGVSAALATVLGTAAALGVVRLRGRRRGWMETALLSPLLVPDIVLAIASLVFFVLVLRLPLGLTTMILAYVVFNISYVAIVVSARLKGYDPALEDAARDLGASPWQAFLRVKLPLIFPGVLAGSLLAFALSLDEFVIAFFVTGPGAATLPIEIHSMVKRGVSPEINALSSLMLLATFLLAGLAVALQRRKW